MRVSVCIATYNGEKYLREQIDSILDQISSDDELVIVDDCSKDNTIEILKSYNDSRIKIFKNEVNQREVFSFGRALSLSNNNVIFMADQDDVWINGRFELMKNEIIKSGQLLLTSNSSFIDHLGNPIDFCIEGVYANDSVRYNRNILAIFAGKTNYYGCTMAFRRELNEIILPIPAYVESHDLWIAMAGNLLKSNIHLDEKTLLRRIHGDNASIVKRNFFAKINSRIIFMRSWIELYKRIKKYNFFK